MTWQRFYRCPKCRVLSAEWSYLCPCRSCGTDNQEGWLPKVVGKRVWKPKWYDWFRVIVELKEQQS